MTPVDPLRLYVDPSWRVVGTPHTPLLYPWWGNTFSSSQPLTKAVLDAYPFDTSLYARTEDVSQADAILLPYRYEVARAIPDLLRQVAAFSTRTNLPLVIDATGDRDYTITLPRSIVLKWGGYRFSKRENEIVMPPYADDLLLRYFDGALQLRAKVEIPTIGFAGRARQTLVQDIRGILKTVPTMLQGMFDERARAMTRGIVVRRRALDALAASSRVWLNSLIRPTYSGNIKTATGDPAELLREFAENAHASDLGLDVRGDANASTRLFELLSLGRVPLIVDTERNFPFSDELNYTAFSIFVDFRDLPRIADIVRDRYDAISEAEWRGMQERARVSYQEWFRPDAMTKHLVKRIRAKSAGYRNV